MNRFCCKFFFKWKRNCSLRTKLSIPVAISPPSDMDVVEGTIPNPMQVTQTIGYVAFMSGSMASFAWVVHIIYNIIFYFHQTFKDQRSNNTTQAQLTNAPGLQKKNIRHKFFTLLSFELKLIRKRIQKREVKELFISCLYFILFFFPHSKLMKFRCVQIPKRAVIEFHEGIGLARMQSQSCWIGFKSRKAEALRLVDHFE
jgi:hypothetical protein